MFPLCDARCSGEEDQISNISGSPSSNVTLSNEDDNVSCGSTNQASSEIEKHSDNSSSPSSNKALSNEDDNVFCGSTDQASSEIEKHSDNSSSPSSNKALSNKDASVSCGSTDQASSEIEKHSDNSSSPFSNKTLSNEDANVSCGSIDQQGGTSSDGEEDSTNSDSDSPSSCESAAEDGEGSSNHQGDFFISDMGQDADNASPGDEIVFNRDLNEEPETPAAGPVGNRVQNEEHRNPFENEDQEAPNRQQRRPSLRELINGVYSDRISAGVDITRSDLLYMALGSAKQNHFTNKAFNDSIQLLNNIFNEPVLPISSARLDSILMEKTSVKHYFYCRSCKKSFGELDYENIKTKLCENCQTVNDISDLRKAHYFCMYDLSRAIEILFNQSEIKDALLRPADAVNKSEPGHISDIYGGSMYKKFAERVKNFTECVISLHFCTDGAALFKSSKSSIWPIMICINELPPEVRMKNILLGGLWFGKCHPPMNLLLKPLSEQAIHLSNGFVIQVRNNPLNMRAYITG
ncbi:hypothetical protein ONE63_011131 [Megalurothrips usitatus]|uniref:Dentin sialophosphoprotein-like n=1 Tax=Megalurothrips usitatus TaxID=439358 RepID=A0AAV7XH16_9NEOP|nr:hypothetical protein ONE63_011131 [Megalurothrips usitatus]